MSDVETQEEITDLVDEILEHFGVRGMHWGIRKPENAGPGPAADDGSGTAADSSDSTTAAPAHHPLSGRNERRAVKNRKKAFNSTRTLSDDEIKSYISRLEMEKKLKTLVKEDVARGRSEVNSILKDAGTNAIKSTLTTSSTAIGLSIAAKVIGKKHPAVGAAIRKKGKI